jgi:hypothetical protein
MNIPGTLKNHGQKQFDNTYHAMHIALNEATDVSRCSIAINVLEKAST